MQTPLLKTNTVLFKKYIKNKANFDLIFNNCKDYTVKQILSYRFKLGYDWVLIGRLMYYAPDAVRQVLARYLMEVTNDNT